MNEPDEKSQHSTQSHAVIFGNSSRPAGIESRSESRTGSRPSVSNLQQAMHSSGYQHEMPPEGPIGGGITQSGAIGGGVTQTNRGSIGGGITQSGRSSRQNFNREEEFDRNRGLSLSPSQYDGRFPPGMAKNHSLSSLQVNLDEKSSAEAELHQYRQQQLRNQAKSPPFKGRRNKGYADIHEKDEIPSYPTFEHHNLERRGRRGQKKESPKRSNSPGKKSPARVLDVGVVDQARRRERVRRAGDEGDNLQRAKAFAREQEKRLSAERRSKGVYIEGIDPSMNGPVKKHKKVKQQPTFKRKPVVRKKRVEKVKVRPSGYKAYTLNDYRELPQVQKNFGGLGADLQNDEYLSKKALKDKAMRHARLLQKQHRDNIPKGKKIKTPEVKELNSRERALAFAKNVPKPKVKGSVGGAGAAGETSTGPTKIQQIVSPAVQNMLQQHDKQRELVDKMRQELGL